MNQLPIQPAWDNVSDAQEWLRLKVPEPFLLALTQLVDGEHSLESIIGSLLAQGFDVDLTWSTIQSLVQNGYLSESISSPFSLLSPEEQERFHDNIVALAAFAEEPGTGSSLPLAGIKAQARLKSAHLLIVGQDRIANRLAGLLDTAGICQIHYSDGDLPPDISSQLVVYCPEIFDVEACRRLNRLCIERSLCFLPARFRTFQVEIGPIVIPHETACYECYWRRVAAAHFTNYGIEIDDEDRDESRLAVLAGVDWLALEIIKIISGVVEPVTRERIWHLDLVSGSAQTHSVLKLPRCPVCGVHKQRPLIKLWEE